MKELPELGSCFPGQGAGAQRGRRRTLRAGGGGCARGGMGTDDPRARLAAALGPGFALICPEGGDASLWLPMGEGWLRPQLGDARREGGPETRAWGWLGRLRGRSQSAPLAASPLELSRGRRM